MMSLSVLVRLQAIIFMSVKKHLRTVVSFFWLIVFSFTSQSLLAKDYFIESPSAFKKTVKKLRAGDVVTLKNGVWQDFDVAFYGKGKKDKPIILKPETKGRVILSGKSNLRISGEYIEVYGLVFKDGYSPRGEVVSFRRDKERHANNSRISEVVIDNFNKPRKFKQDYWVGMYGKNNRFDHNHLTGKKNRGVTMAVRLQGEEHWENNHRIDYNYFGPRPVFGSNGAETLRIGTSKYSLKQSNTIVEHNYFDRCNGEVEVISNKSGGNVFRNNTFFESRGTLTMRHGNGNLIEDNFFFGNHKDHTGGIRIINADQTVRNNYMYGLTGYRFGGAFVVMNGSYDPPINRYHQVKNATIENNSIIDSDYIQLAAGSDDERNAPPINSTMTNNLFYSSQPKDIFTVYDDISGIKYSRNVLTNVKKAPYKEGFFDIETQIEKDKYGVYHPVNPAIATVGISRDIRPITRDEVGVSWYPKSNPEKVFDLVPAVTVKPGLDSLTKAIAESKAGSVYNLLPGEYSVSKPIELNHAVSLIGQTNTANKSGEPAVSVSFLGQSLFTLNDGSSLKLHNLSISGSKSEKSSTGNSVIRTESAMLSNYQLLLDAVVVTGLNKRANFNFLTVSQYTVADLIEIANSKISDVSGSVLALDKETEDRGIYNAEYVTIKNSHFSNVDGGLVSLYRGGTDESTFGPHFSLTDSVMTNVGEQLSKDTVPMINLHGVQVTKIKNKRFLDSGAFIVNHTVGEPVTIITDNRFSKSSMPKITELVSSKKDTAVLQNNVEL